MPPNCPEFSRCHCRPSPGSGADGGGSLASVARAAASEAMDPAGAPIPPEPPPASVLFPALEPPPPPQACRARLRTMRELSPSARVLPISLDAQAQSPSRLRRKQSGTRRWRSANGSRHNELVVFRPPPLQAIAEPSNPSGPSLCTHDKGGFEHPLPGRRRRGARPLGAAWWGESLDQTPPGIGSRSRPDPGASLDRGATCGSCRAWLRARFFRRRCG